MNVVKFSDFAQNADIPSAEYVLADRPLVGVFVKKDNT